MKKNTRIVIRYHSGLSAFALQAHVFMLSNVSPIFEKMFSIDMKERKEGLVRIDEFCHEAVWEMVRYIYGMMPDEEKLAFDQSCDLFCAAHMSAAHSVLAAVFKLVWKV